MIEGQRGREIFVLYCPGESPYDVDDDHDLNGVADLDEEVEVDDVGDNEYDAFDGPSKDD